MLYPSELRGHGLNYGIICPLESAVLLYRTTNILRVADCPPALIRAR